MGIRWNLTNKHGSHGSSLLRQKNGQIHPLAEATCLANRLEDTINIYHLVI